MHAFKKPKKSQEHFSIIMNDDDQNDGNDYQQNSSDYTLIKLMKS